MLLADEARRERHGRERHRDAVGVLGELLLGHDRPRRAAARAHERNLGRHLLEEVLGLLHGAEVGAERHLLHAGEAQLLEGLAQLVDVALTAELTHERGRHLGDDLVAVGDGLDDLEDLTLVGNGAEGAVHEALAAAHALVVVDVGVAVLVRADGAHAAGVGAGTHVVVDGVVGTHVGAAAALDAERVVDEGLLVLERDGLLGADLAAGVRETALAGLAHDAVDVVLAGVAGELDDVDEGRLVVGLGLGRLGHAVGERLALVDALERQAHGEADALAHDGALEEDALAVGSDVAGDDLVGQVVDPAIVRLLATLLGRLAAGIGKLCHLAEHRTANLREVGVDASHRAWHMVPFLSCMADELAPATLMPGPWPRCGRLPGQPAGGPCRRNFYLW